MIELPLCAVRMIRIASWLGLARIPVQRRHLEGFPPSFLLLGWHIFDLSGDPPNIAARVFDATISLTRRQRHDGKDRNSACVERGMINGVRVAHVEINRGRHRSKRWGGVG